MYSLTQSIENGLWKIALGGRIDSSNAGEAEAQLTDDPSVQKICIDAEQLEYISSAGLRIVLRLLKKHPEVEMINVSPEVYEILDVTGFKEMMTVRKAFRAMSIDGCPVLGKGSNGIVYRTDPETIVKVYYDKNALPDILHEREVARRALILGIPTAIAYDVVKVGDSYGSVFELLDADTMSTYIKNNPEKLADYAKEYADFLRHIHEIETAPGTFPSVKETALNWAKFLNGYLPEETYSKLISLIEAVPEDNHLIHGDFHTNNLMCQERETLLIDMDTLSQGHPVFEFASIFLGFVAFHELEPETCENFLGFSADVAAAFLKEGTKQYFGGDEKRAELALRSSSIVGYTRLMRRTIRRIGLDDPFGKKQTDYCREKLIALCAEIDDLTEAWN